MSLEYYFYYFYYTFVGYPFVLKVAVIAVTVFAPFFLITSVKFLLNRRNHYKKRRIRHKLDKNYLKKVEEIITSKKVHYLKDINEYIKCDIKKLTNRQKRILTNSILKIHRHAEFTKEENYQNVIAYFSLQNFWEDKLKYGSLAHKQRALRKLDDLDIEIPGSMITYLTYNRNPYLRKRARSSYMYFSRSNPFKFLDEDFDKTFNNWDKIEIHRMLERRTKYGQLPNLTQWFKNSKHSEFKCFLIDEIKYFNQKECAPYLLELAISSPDINIRKHSIEALGSLKYTEAENHLIKDFVIQPNPIKQCIVNVIQQLNTGKSLPFLHRAYKSTHDRDSEIASLKAIYNYGDEGRQLFNTMKNEAMGFSHLIFEHVSNPLIKQT